MIRVVNRFFLIGGIALAIFPFWAWANYDTPNPGRSTLKTSSMGDATTRQKQPLGIKTPEQKQAVEEVNALIVDSYKTLLDKVLSQLYLNISEASKGDRAIQVRALSKVRDDLDKKLDSLEDENITPNRKKILQGVYFYLKSNVELKIQTLQKK